MILTETKENPISDVIAKPATNGSGDSIYDFVAEPNKSDSIYDFVAAKSDQPASIEPKLTMPEIPMANTLDTSTPDYSLYRDPTGFPRGSTEEEIRKRAGEDFDTAKNTGLPLSEISNASKGLKQKRGFFKTIDYLNNRFGNQLFNSTVASINQTVSGRDSTPAEDRAFELLHMWQRENNVRLTDSAHDEQLADWIRQLYNKPEARDTDYLKTEPQYFLPKEVSSYFDKRQVERPEGWLDTGVDIVAGILGYVFEYAALKKAIPSAPSYVIGGAVSRANGDKWSSGAAMMASVDLMGGLFPDKGILNKIMGGVATGTIFGGTNAIASYNETGKVDVKSTVINFGIPTVLSTIGIVKSDWEKIKPESKTRLIREVKEIVPELKEVSNEVVSNIIRDELPEVRETISGTGGVEKPIEQSMLPPVDQTQAGAGNAAGQTAKQPWEMTRDEWNKSPDGQVAPFADNKKQLASPVFKSRAEAEAWAKRHGLENDGNVNGFKDEDGEQWQWRYTDIDAHKMAVAAAINRGELVPPEVLAEYPDLAKQSEPGKGVAREQEQALKIGEAMLGLPPEEPPVKAATGAVAGNAHPLPETVAPLPEKFYHGTPHSFDKIKGNVGGLVFYTDKPSAASWYATGGGGGRSDAIGEVAIVDEDGIVFKKSQDGQWESWGKLNDNGMPIQDKSIKHIILPPDYVNTEISKQGMGSLSTIGLSGRIIESDAEGIYLDLRKQKGLDVLSSLDPQGNKTALGIIENAKKKNTWTGNSSFAWESTKYTYTKSPVGYDIAWRDIIIPQLKKLGYDGIYYFDDSGLTWAKFDTPEPAAGQTAKQPLIEKQDDVHNSVSRILREQFPSPQYSAKSEAQYFDNGQIRVRLAEHPVVYPESDVDIVIGIGKNAGADSDLIFEAGKHTEQELRDKINTAIEKATLKHEIDNFVETDEPLSKETQILAKKYPDLLPPEVLAEYPDLAKQPETDKGEVKAVDETTGNLPITTEEPKLFSIMNDMVDEQRKALGQEPLMESAVRSDKKVFNEAAKIVQDNPKAIDNLIEDLSRKSRPTTGVENVMLDYKLVELSTRVKKLANQQAEAIGSGDEKAIAEISKRFDVALEEYKNLTDLTKVTGKQSSESLRTRQILMKEDYSFASAAERVSTAKRGKLTIEQQQTLKDLTDRIEQITEDYETRIKNLESQRIIENLAKPEGKKSQTADRTSFGSKNRIFTKERADRARTELKAMMSQMNVGLNPAALVKLTELGGYYFEGGIREIGAWSAKIIEDLGEDVKPHLQDVYERVSKQFGESERKEAVDKIAKSFDKKGDLTGSYQAIGKLGRMLVADGIRDRDELSKAIQDILKPSIPDITVRQIDEAIVRYGEYTPPSKEEVEVEYQKLKGQKRQVLKLQDIREGKVPLKTGKGHQAPDAEERALIKQVNEALKESGLKAVDPEMQAKTALETKRTRLGNRLEDLKKQVESRTRTIKDKKVTPEDEGTMSLRAEIDKTQKEYDAIFGEEERLGALNKRLDKRMAELQETLDKGDFAPKVKEKPSYKLDPETLQKQFEVNKLKNKIDQMVFDYQQANRTTSEKAVALIRDLRLFNILSWPTVLQKLPTAAALRSGISTPMAELVTSVTRQLPGFRELAKGAPRWGEGFKGGTFIRAKINTIKNFKKSFTDALKTGQTDITILANKNPRVSKSLLHIWGNVHLALKTFSLEDEFYQSLERRMRWESKSIYEGGGGIETDNIFEQERITTMAAQDAMRAILQGQDTMAHQGYKNFLQWASRKDPSTGKPYLERQVLQVLIQNQIPIHNVPSNIFSELMTLNFGLGTGSVKAVRAWIRGVDKTTPEQKDAIFKHIAYGTMGTLGAGLFGWLNYKNIEPYYWLGQKKDKPKDSSWYKAIYHFPLGMQAKMWASIRWAIDETAKEQGMSWTEGHLLGVWRGFSGAFESLPFVRTSVDFAKLYTERTKGLERAVDEFIKSQIVPGLSQGIANWMDKDAEGNVIKRNPKNLKETIETGIPGLRKEVKRK